MNIRLQLLACCLSLFASTHSHALFRCGSVFQDRPCDESSAQTAATRLAAKPKAGSSASSAAQAGAPAGTSPFAMVCGRMAKSSMAISWKREAGATREAQLASPPGGGEYQKLVEAVYQRRGSAPEVSAAIEADCISERQRQADAAAALAALTQAAGGDAPATPPKAAAQPKAEVAQADAPKPVAAKDNSGRCATLRSDLATLQARARAGGSVATMEHINSERRAVDRQISSAKCG